jgi:hypothetical protein
MHQLFAIDAGRGYRKWQTRVAITKIAVVAKARAQLLDLIRRYAPK